MTRIPILYLTSYGISLLGNSVTAIALPLLVLLTTGSAGDAGLVAIAGAVPAALAGLLMGSLVDRINRRTAAILSDVISALALALLPIIDATVGLSLGWFIAIAVLNSFGDVPGITAREAMLPAIARAARMDASRLIGLRESLGGVSLLAGPAGAGILVAALEPAAVMWVTASIAALAALLTLLLPPHATAHVRDESRPSFRAAAGSVFRGVGIIARTPLLRALILLMLALAVVLAALQGMVIPVHFAFQGEASLVGFVLSALAVGLLVGGGLFAVLGERIPRAVWLVVGVLMIAVGLAVLATLGPVWTIFTGAAIVGLGGGSMNAVVGLTFVETVEEGRRGAVLGAQNALLTLVPAVGIGGAALLIEAGSLDLAATVIAGVWIHQLTSSGLPLATAGELAADPAPHAAEEVLEEADRMLESQIAVLTERHARLAEARAGGHVGLSREAAALTVENADMPPAILLAHLYRDHPQFGRLTDALLQPERRALLMKIQRRFDAIDEHTPEAELEDIAARVQEVHADAADDLPPLREDWLRLVRELVERDLNPRQREFLRSQE